MTDRTLTRHTIEQLVQAAAAAPSPRNSQPWRFVAWPAERIIEVYADPARAPRAGDPRGRGVHIAGGAALFNLSLAAVGEGFEPVIRLLPRRSDPLLLAAVRLGGRHRPPPAETALRAVIQRPSAAWLPLPDRPPPRALLGALSEAAAIQGASLRALDQADVAWLLRVGAAATADPAFGAALRAWAGSARRDAGAPGADAMPDAPASAPEPSVHAAPGAQRLLAAVCVRDDNRASWLRAGQAAQRVLLLAASAGMHAAPLGAVPEGPDTPVRHDPRFGGEHPTMVLGLGGEQADLPASRRPASQVLRVMGPVRPKDKGPALAPPAALPAGSRQLMRSQ